MRRRPHEDTELDSFPPVADVLEHYFGSRFTPWKQGAWAPCRCPFHEDAHASASVSTEHNIFFCHGCGVSTSGLGMVVRVEDCDVDSAKRIAARLFGGGDGVLPEVTADGGGLPRRERDPARPRRRIPVGRRRRALLGT